MIRTRHVRRQRVCPSVPVLAWLWALLVICALPTPCAEGELSAGLPPSLNFNRLTVDDGLSQGTIFAILQDSRGFMWFGTQDGLNRYDGYEFTIYRESPSDPSSLAESWVTALIEGRDGKLWVGTQQNWVNRFDPATETFTRFVPGDEAPNLDGFHAIRALHQDASGRLWLVAGQEVYALNPATGVYTHYPTGEPGNRAGGLGLPVVLLENGDNTLWLGFMGELYTFSPSRDTWERFSLPRGSGGEEALFWWIYMEGDSGPYMLTSQGAYVFDPSTKSFLEGERESFFLKRLLGNWNVVSAVRDPCGIWWLASQDQGLVLFDMDSMNFSNYLPDPETPGALSTNELTSVYLDRSGVVWIGTNGRGLHTKDRLKREFTTLRHRPNHEHSLIENHIWSICETADGMVWIGTRRGLDRWNRRTGAFTHYLNDPDDPSSPSDNRIASLCEDGAGRLWVGTYGAGLNRYDASTDQFVRYAQELGNCPIPQNDTVQDMLAAGDGLLWLGTRTGLYSMNPETGTFDSYVNDPIDPSSLSNNVVRIVYEDRKETLWIGTVGGLNRMDRQAGTFERFLTRPMNPRTLAANNVHALWDAGDGALWVGTFGGGLHRMDPQAGTFQRLMGEGILPDNVVYGILGDESDRLWLSTNTGLVRFDPGDGTHRRYDVQDGLQSGEFNACAYFKSESGELFFGGVEGLNLFHPDTLADNPIPPEVAITRFSLLNRETAEESHPVRCGALPVTSEVHLAHDENQFSLEYVALHYSYPSKNRYAYRMEGFDGRWQEAGTRRVAIYTNLDPGDYVFRIKACNADGVWNGEGASLRLHIAPPWWMTWWAYSLYAALAALSLFLFYLSIKRRERMRTVLTESRLRAQAAELQVRVAETQAQVLHAQNEQKTRELEEARRLQMSMLPKELPVVPGLRIAVHMETANMVGGDYYDFYKDRDGSLTVAVGDATGHSTKAGIMVAIVKGLFSAWSGRTDLPAFLERCDRILTRMKLENIYMALMLLKFQGRKVTAVAAAMPPILVYRRATKKVEEIVLRGMFLGFDLRLPMGRRKFTLEPGDTMLLMSDGFPDLFNPAGETLEFHRVKEAFRERGEALPEEIIDRFNRLAEEWRSGEPVNDDITFVVIQLDPDHDWDRPDESSRKPLAPGSETVFP